MSMDKNAEIKSGIYPKDKVNLQDIIESIKKNPSVKKAGAIHTFTGIVRGSSNEGKAVEGMKIDAYDELANNNIHKICEELKKRPGIIDVKIIHLKGEFDLSEDLVYVVVASAHRKEGFEAISNAVDMYKKEIEVWKREDFSDGTSKWLH